jgi:hypothetical protein
MRINDFIDRSRLGWTACLLVTTTMGTAPASAAITVTSDPILYWNDVALNNVITNAPAQSRIFAMANIAMHDAVNATLGGPNRGYLSGVVTPGGDSRAAAAQAAHDVLVVLNPANTAVYDMALANSLAQIGSGRSLHHHWSPRRLASDATGVQCARRARLGRRQELRVVGRRQRGRASGTTSRAHQRRICRGLQ